MRSNVTAHNFRDADENPAGGITSGCGFTIAWQNGPLGRGEGRDEPNGAFVEDVIAAAVDRLRFYQLSKFKCRENEDAIDYLCRALERLDTRTANRESRGGEGTHAV